ncbi:TRAP transporter large permease [Roseomonas sp. PWR1]|uniref:TRAP transporter large permease protein n=1 Tax=Roseomonas nitratireducens TaxID=2820810 RepID=A0ABS4ARM2_9PROT|nr:TRAP transporter large permease [Neoroseomonas nitratireducens]MBP0464000.1 TRAP transporter large permease [Neoroseomonas nitratireducens]
MSEIGWFLTAGFGLLVVLGVPFAIAIALAITGALIAADIEPAFLAQSVVSGSQQFSLLAIPLFMLAGELMSAGGLSQRLVDFASTLVRHLRGGLAMVTVLAALIFSAISGSAPATTAAIGAIMIPAMAKAGYDKGFAASIAVSAGVLGPLIPPSIAFVIWGIVAEQSIGRLFLSGIVPGLVLAAGLLVICWGHAKRNDVPMLPRATLREAGAAFARGRWALASPLVVLGGIYGGIFTPTEAAAISCVYALLVGLLIERQLTLRALPGIFVNAMRTSAIVTAIIAVSTGFGILVAQEQIATQFAGWLASTVSEKWLALAALNIAFFLLAAVMDEIAIMVILGPMLIAIANRFGVDPIHFGAIIVTNVSIGMAAPPIGYCLFIGMAISGLSLARISRAIWPQIAWMLVVLFLTTYIPGFALMFQPAAR